MKTATFACLLFLASLSGCAAPAEEPAAEPIDTGEDALGSCTGVAVPGDYADLQQALDAGNASICLGAGTFADAYRLPIGGHVKITGRGAGQTTIGAVLGMLAEVELSRVTVTEGVVLRNPRDTRIHHARLRAGGTGSWSWVPATSNTARLDSYGSAIAVLDEESSMAGGRGIVEISDCDVSRGTFNGYDYTNRSAGILLDHVASARVLRNVVHDVPNGLVLSARGSDHAEITGNTIRDTGADPFGNGLLLDVSGSADVTYSHNTVRHHRIGVNLTLGQGNPSVAHEANTLTANAANYAGAAKPD